VLFQPIVGRARRKVDQRAAPNKKPPQSSGSQMRQQPPLFLPTPAADAGYSPIKRRGTLARSPKVSAFLGFHRQTLRLTRLYPFGAGVDAGAILCNRLLKFTRHINLCCCAGCAAARQQKRAKEDKCPYHRRARYYKLSYSIPSLRSSHDRQKIFDRYRAGHPNRGTN
jgi:hypothetical protein